LNELRYLLNAYYTELLKQNCV